MDNMNNGPAPAVSIVLPTYNRAKFLPQAFASIRSQTFADWELIVVDDGSTDDTKQLVDDLSKTMPGPVRYQYQANQGAYGARNTGLDQARGRYIAFFDSDDVWLPDYLSACAQALNANADVDWVYGACRRVDHATGRVLVPSTFHLGGKPRPFLRLRSIQKGDLHIITDSRAVQCGLVHGLYCGLQNSVLRRTLFEKYRFETGFRNEAEDQLFVVRILAAGGRLAYFNRVFVDYYEHDSNSSGSGSDKDVEKHLTIMKALVRGYEQLGREVTLTRREERALRRRLSREYFWHLGYSLLWRNSRRREALAMFERGLKLWPWDAACWKTYFLARLRAYPRSFAGTS
jgi:glycosyltransferase involved in cell wall biosynthesis